MVSLKTFVASFCAVLGVAHAQNVTVPDHCTAGYESGTSTAIFTVPYTYNQVMSIIGSYKNLTWSGNPDDTVTLNGTDNTTYDTAGAHVIETILIYSKPADGPYNEVHNTALLSVPAANVSFYIPYDGTVVTPICNGAASTFNFTAHYCGSNGTLTGSILSSLHTTDAMTVGQFLGGANFTSCAALSQNGGSSTTTASVPVYTGAAMRNMVAGGSVIAAVAGLVLVL